MMSEVVVAIISAAILIPEETMHSMQWFGAIAIISAGVFEVLYGYNKKPHKNMLVKKWNFILGENKNTPKEKN